MTMQTFPLPEEVRGKLRDRARTEVRTVKVGLDGAHIESTPLGELAGPEFMALQNVLSLVEHLKGYEFVPLDPDDVFETIEEQRGKHRGFLNAANWLLDRIDAGLRGQAVGAKEETDV